MVKKNILLGEFLMEQGLITDSQLRQALKYHHERGIKLGRALIDLGFVNENDMIKSLSTQLGVQYINLKNYRIDPEVIDLVPDDLAWTYYVIPLFRLHNRLSVAMVNPLDVFALDALTRTAKLKVEPVVAMEADVLEGLRMFYPKKESEKSEQEQRDTTHVGSVTVVDQGQEQDNIILQIDELLARLIDQKAYRATVAANKLKVAFAHHCENWDLPENMDAKAFIRNLCNLGMDHNPNERAPKHFVIQKSEDVKFHLLTNMNHQNEVLTFFLQIPRDNLLESNQNTLFADVTKEKPAPGITLLLAPDSVYLDAIYYGLLKKSTKQFSSVLSLETRPSESIGDALQLVTMQPTDQIAAIRYAELSGVNALFCKNIRDKFAMANALAIAESGASVVIACPSAAPWDAIKYLFSGRDRQLFARQIRQIYICYPLKNAIENAGDVKNRLHIPPKHDFQNVPAEQQNNYLLEALWRSESSEKQVETREQFEHIGATLRKKLREDIMQLEVNVT